MQPVPAQRVTPLQHGAQQQHRLDEPVTAAAVTAAATAAAVSPPVSSPPVHGADGGDGAQRGSRPPSQHASRSLRRPGGVAAPTPAPSGGSPIQAAATLATAAATTAFESGPRLEYCQLTNGLNTHSELTDSWNFLWTYRNSSPLNLG